MMGTLGKPSDINGVDSRDFDITDLSNTVDRQAREIVILREALHTFHTMVCDQFDPDPEPVEHYLNWEGERIARFMEVYYR